MVGLLLGPVLAAFDDSLAAIGIVRLRALHAGGGAVAPVAARMLALDRIIHARLAAGRVFCLATSTSAACYLTLQSGNAAWVVVLFTAAVALCFAMLLGMYGAWLRRLPSHTLLLLFRWLRPIEWLLAPLGGALNWLSYLVLRWIPAASRPSIGEGISELEVEHVIERGEQSGEIQRDHAQLLRSVLEFKNTVAREVMVPRAAVVAIEISTPLDKVHQLMVENGHSRYPVFRSGLDQLEGILYAKDLFQLLAGSPKHPSVELRQLIRRPVFFCTEEQKIGVLLREMQVKRVHLAVVVDEFGGVSGIVTLEDILEEIVGDIRDEHDEEEATVRQIAPGRYLVDAGLSVHDLAEHLGRPLRAPSGEYESIGGLVIEIAGRVPHAGEMVVFEDLELTVRESDNRRVRQLEIAQRAPVEVVA